MPHLPQVKKGQTSGTILKSACDHAAARYDPSRDRWECPACHKAWIERAAALDRIQSLTRSVISTLGTAKAEIERL